MVQISRKKYLYFFLKSTSLLDHRRGHNFFLRMGDKRYITVSHRLIVEINENKKKKTDL